MRRSLLALVLALTAAAPAAVAQEVPVGPPLAGFTPVRVSIMPAQLWRADSAGWSRQVTWAATRLALDSAVQAVLEERGLGRKWAYPSDVVRSAKRNPTYAADPYSLGVGRLRTGELKVGTPIPQVLGDNLRSLTALGDTRFALIPVELRAQGTDVVLRLVLVDTRSRSLVWAGDLLSPGGDGMVGQLATRVADLIIEP